MFSAETLGRAQPESLGLYGVFSGRVPVSTYWGFPGPGSQYKSRQHRLGISFLSCWVGPVDSSHLSKKLDRRLGSTAWNVEVQSNLSEREFHCNTRLSNEGQVSTLTCVRVQAEIVIVLGFTNSNQPHFPARCILDSPKSGILIQEAGDESCYDLRADLMPCLNETEICINCTKRIIANAESSMQ